MTHYNGGYTLYISKSIYHTIPSMNLGIHYALQMSLICPLSNADIPCMTSKVRKAMDMWGKSCMGNLSVPNFT